MLHFNAEKFDFWSIYECIKQFYPIGFKKDDPWKMFFAYPGLKRLGGIKLEKIHDEGNYPQWKEFTEEIETISKKQVTGTTWGQTPCFSSYIVLETITLDGLTREKQLHFFVSLVGEFYTVIGQEIISLQSENRAYRTTGCLVVSPVEEFQELFNLLCQKIEERFKRYKFVPFEISKQTIEGLDVDYCDETLNTVFHALFNNNIELNTSLIIGDEYYKFDDWIKEGYKEEEGGWTMYPLE